MIEKISNKKKIQVVGVGGLILNKKGEILLTKRIEPAFPQWNGKWGIPGGHVEFGENPKEALHRELKEELGIEVKIIINTPFVDSETLDLEKMIYHGIFLCFPCLIIKGKPKKKSAEHSDIEWFKPAEIDYRRCIPFTENFIKQLLMIKSFYPVFEDDYIAAIFRIAKNNGNKITDKMILKEVQKQGKGRKHES